MGDLFDGKPFLVGDRPTIADISVYCVVAYMDEGKFDITAWPQVKAWADRPSPFYLPA